MPEQNKAVGIAVHTFMQLGVQLGMVSWDQENVILTEYDCIITYRHYIGPVFVQNTINGGYFHKYFHFPSYLQVALQHGLDINFPPQAVSKHSH